MIRKAPTEKIAVSRDRIIRSIASSSAIKTGEKIETIEKRLKSSVRLFGHISLAK